MTEETEPAPWYHAGLRFKCTQCGNCCTGAPGVVWVTEDEIRAIAASRGLSLGETRINHTRLVGGRMTLREFANGDCTFLDGATRRCSIYSDRPAQCRTWPFWNSNLESPAQWERAQVKCPGMGQGELVQLEAIQHQAAIVDI
jgi:Fe-S-cluster containining protein